MSPHLYKKRKGGPATYEVVHGPAGDAWFFGQTLSSMKLPLPGGGSARYVSSGGTVGLQMFSHPDWQGNARLSTSPRVARTLADKT